MKKTALLALTLLTGCAAATPPDCAPGIKAEVRQPPAECMLPCDPLTPPAGPTLADTMQAAVGAALNQKECARRHWCLVEWAGGK